MARRRSKVGMKKPRRVGTEELNRQKYMGLASCGQLDAPRWGFSSSKLGKLDVCVFYAKFAAKKFLDLMIGEDEVEWIDDQTLITSRDVLIRTQSNKKKYMLRTIYDHKVSYNEERYHSFGEGYLKRAALIRSDDSAKAFVPGETHSTKQRRSRKGMTLMKTIAEELGMTPRVARGILRGVMKKPEHGWAWRTQVEVDRIKAILQGQPVRSLRVDFTGVTNGS